ncbi:Alpha-amylase, C-terminal beta-sheet [Dillenia turbinata]|uniref:alpha-amylase n=1 Tax=Dillenia turbinata TaxID=194707 RepID=A0AAN8V498_9MAGN
MDVPLLPKTAIRALPCKSNTFQSRGLNRFYRWDHLDLGHHSIGKRKCTHLGNWSCKTVTVVFSGGGDSSETSADVFNDDDGFLYGNGDVLELDDNELEKAKVALAEAQTRLESLEKERDQLLEELARSEAKQQEYVVTIRHEKELAVAELEAAKPLFNQKLQESVEEKFHLESKLVLVKQDAIDLAVQVEKLAEIAFQQATSHILEDAQLKVLAAETSASEAAYNIEEQLRTATEGALLPIVEQSKVAIEKALTVAESASDHAKKVMAAVTDAVTPVDWIASLQLQNSKLESMVNELESQLLLTRCEVDRLKLELEQADAKAIASEQRASEIEKVLVEFQDSSRNKALHQEEEVKSLMEKLKKDAAERKKAVSRAFKAELDGIKAAIEATKETAHSKDEAHMRRCEALQRSLRASETASQMWRQRAEMAESLLLKGRSSVEEDEDAIYVVNGGRIELFTDDDAQKWKLLSIGPRQEIPEWMARRIRTFCPKFPPRKIDVSEALKLKSGSLVLPKPDEVWSVVQEKPKEGDTFIEHVIEKEIIEKKRKALERALQRKTIHRTPEQTKLEPGTGTGREIVFQGFNWESWRRQWYQELATKAADLSKCGMTAVWLPPPTESVAPQGYMPSDLYNLNSAYGSEEQLKYCIEEMHAQDLLALGDVVLNHRCAQKQSPNGVWNIFGGKLAWGPEAIVCDDPNFQGRGNPSSEVFQNTLNIQILHLPLENTGIVWLMKVATSVITKGHWPFPRDKLTQGYAYILTHPGTPVIFYDHFYDFGLRDVIIELIEARRRAGVHCRSSVKIYHANNDGYVAQIGDTLVMKLGHFDWNPSKENQLEGTWQKFVEKGSEYQLWLRQ